MRLKDVLDLLVLSALWGASFLFMRVAAPEFGPLVIGFLRALIATLLLLPFLLLRSGIAELRSNWKKLVLVGVLNSAIPFCLLALATISLSGGFAAILNSTAPLWAAMIAWIWLGDRLDRRRITGLIIGFTGVVVLVWNKAGIAAPGVAMAILAAVSAALFYGIGANFTQKYLHGISALALATGSMLAATIVLLPAGILLWPAKMISVQAWIAIIMMGVASTGIAYVLYFRLIANVGPAKAITTTYLVPGFAVVWGAMFINESLSANMVLGGAIILIGTALATGVLSFSRK